jgi:hypothetical protein
VCGDEHACSVRVILNEGYLAETSDSHDDESGMLRHDDGGSNRL